MLLRRFTVSVAALAVALASATTFAGAAHADPGVAGTYNKVAPTRVLDTRSGVGAVKAPIAAGGSLTFNAMSGVTDLASAVALTLTVVGPKSYGYLTVQPTGSPKGITSALTYFPGMTAANSTIVGVGLGGAVTVYNQSGGTVDVIADRTGFWTAGVVADGTAGALHPVTPARIYDTRSDGGAPLGPMADLKVPVTSKGGVPAGNVSAAVVNLTVTATTSQGYLTGDSEVSQTRPWPSSLNYLAKQTRSNLAVLPVNPDGTISVYNVSTGTAHVVVDVLGYVDDGTPYLDGAYLASTPYRVLDTRLTGTTIPANSTRTLALLPDDGTALVFKAMEVNITVTNQKSTGHLVAWDGTTAMPAVSNNQFVRADNGATSTVLSVNPDGTVKIFNASPGSLDLVIDVTGFVLNDLSSPAAKSTFGTGVTGSKAASPATARQTLVKAAVAKAEQYVGR